MLPLWNHVRALPIIAAVEGHHHLAGIDAGKQVFVFAFPLAGAKPQHVHRRADFLDFEARAFADQRMAAIAGNGQAGRDIDDAIRRLRLHARDAIAVPDEVDRLRRHHHFQRSKPLAALAQEIEKVPLWHEGDEGIFDVVPAQDGEPHRLAAEHPLHPLQPLMRQFQEAVDQPELVHHLQRGGMHGVAAKIAEEIRMLLQHHDVDAGASEQVTEHHARGPTADDTAAHLHRFTPSHR